MTTKSDINIICSDSYTIAATLFTPNKEVKGAVMICPATGIKRQFYASFAQYLCDIGYGVITFDNRGIAGSLTGKVSQSNASLKCWGEKDMPAVLETLKSHFPNVRYHLVGHSAGGQLIGLMHNAKDIHSAFNFACSSGNLSNMHWSYIFKAHFFMNAFIPFSNLFFGHTKSQWVGMGEPLPKKVAKQWQFWCNGSGYVATDFGKAIETHLYDELTLPILWTNATDDNIANNANVDDMMRVFTKAAKHAQKRTFEPKAYNLDEIGHMKFFSRKAQHLWPQVDEWFTQHSE